MTAQFHEGQEVEVREYHGEHVRGWRRATIAHYVNVDHQLRDHYEVEFRNGSRAVFDAKHIRAIDSPSRTAAKKVARDLGKALMGRGP